MKNEREKEIEGVRFPGKSWKFLSEDARYRTGRGAIIPRGYPGQKPKKRDISISRPRAVEKTRRESYIRCRGSRKPVAGRPVVPNFLKIPDVPAFSVIPDVPVG